MTDATPPSNPASRPPAVPVTVGSTVRLRDAEGEHEHTVVERLTGAAPPGCVSAGSPVGRALLGRRPGEQVQVQTPDGARLLTIVERPGRPRSPRRPPSRAAQISPRREATTTVSTRLRVCSFSWALRT